MPTENRSSNTEMVSLPRELSDDLAELIAIRARVCGGGAYEIWEAICKGFAAPAPQPHPEPIAWMVGTAIWWTKEEAERDAAATALPMIGVGPMVDPVLTERLAKATAFVQRLVDCSGTQPSVATGYLRDILDELKGSTTPTAPVERDERRGFEDHHRICDLVRDEDCPEHYRNQSVQDSWEGWQSRAAVGCMTS